MILLYRQSNWQFPNDALCSALDVCINFQTKLSSCAHLETVADAKHWNSIIVDGRVNPGRILVVNGVRRAREDDACSRSLSTSRNDRTTFQAEAHL